MTAPTEIRPRISILIPAFNEEALIGRVLDCVHASFTGNPRHPYEIVVCDNNSTDRTSTVAASRGARVAFEPHNQIARARNTAAKAALGEWFIFLDGDTFLTAALLEKTIACFESGRIAGGGSVLRFDMENLGALAGAMTRFWNGVSATFHLAAGSYLFCHRDAWAETGGFPEDTYVGEELFFSRNLKRWARSRGQKFRVITDAPITTSARKIEWYGQREMMMHMLRLSFPGAWKRREKCGMWYTRPAAANTEAK